jgi:catechol 2,3-dioxygenase-like lactoylglutathione lyase family enzyme
MMSQNNKTRISEVRTVAIPVTDQDRAIAFFVDILGFEKRLDVPFGGGQRWIEVAPAGSQASIALPPAGGTAAPVDTGIRLSTASADEDHADLQNRGVDVDAEVLRFGEGVPPMFSFRDPDGNTLYVVEDMA